MTETICKEIAEERAGICEFDGLLTREQAEAQGLLESEAYRNSCEVRHVIGLDLNQRRDYLDRVEKVRGLVPGSKLREAVRTEWIKRRAGK